MTVHRFLTPVDMATHSFSVYGAVAWQSCHVLGQGITHLVDTSARPPASGGHLCQVTSISPTAGRVSVQTSRVATVGCYGDAMAGVDGSRCFLSFQGCIG